MSRRNNKTKSVGFHKDFKPATTQQRSEALGPFPFEHNVNNNRQHMLATSAKVGQPSLELLKAEKIDNDKKKNSTETDTNQQDGEEDKELVMAIEDLNNRKLYKPTPKSEISLAITKPKDDLDWLAQVPEDGQTFMDFVTFLSTRKTGRMKSIANAKGIEILLLPILRAQPNDTFQNNNLQWPDYGPPLEQLLRYTEAFFDRPVRILPAAQIHVNHKKITNSTKRATKKRKLSNNNNKSKRNSNPSINDDNDDDDNTINDIGAFASSTAKGKFKLYLPQIDGSLPKSPVNIAGRSDFKSDRIQLQVTSLLDELSRYRYGRQDSLTSTTTTTTTTTTTNLPDFCIMGVTMEDLYDGPSDLFCAGMAFGGDKVAVFSFHRYHPFMKMHPQHWHNYGYTSKCDGYSYYEDDNQNPTGLASYPPSNLTTSDDKKFESEFFRRSVKLLTHELGHLYGLDHCIHNRCLMMGTGHLVEDFAAPLHLCGICLRKLQWRTGFSVKYRYKLLSTALNEMNMTKEAQWTTKQYTHLSK